jgi:hypothetical protein
MWCRKIQQNGQAQFLKAGFNGIAKRDVNHDANLCGVNVCARRDAKAAVIGLFADAINFYAIDDAIVE